MSCGKGALVVQSRKWLSSGHICLLGLHCRVATFPQQKSIGCFLFPLPSRCIYNPTFTKSTMTSPKGLSHILLIFITSLTTTNKTILSHFQNTYKVAKHPKLKVWAPLQDASNSTKQHHKELDSPYSQFQFNQWELGGKTIVHNLVPQDYRFSRMLATSRKHEVNFCNKLSYEATITQSMW